MTRPCSPLPRLLILLVFGLILVSALAIPNPSHGQGTEGSETVQTNPKSRSRTVTASVPDGADPETPLLISPEDETLLTTNKPLFEWYLTEDNTGVTTYQLYLDGAVLFADIGTGNQETSQYSLSYNAATEVYTLNPKQGLPEGSHTWKIRALDAAGNSSDSITWTFTIDTQAPALVVTDIGEASVSISAQDVSTVPQAPILLTDNEPLLQGTGEAGAEVVMTVTAEGESYGEEYYFYVDADGTWYIYLDLLTRELTYFLDFVITDEAGNVSILEDVPIRLQKAATVIIPLGTLPPPFEETDVTIPISPGEEGVKEVVQEEIKPRLPAPLHPVVEASLRVDRQSWWYLSLPLLYLVWQLGRLLLVLGPFGWRSSLSLIWQGMVAVGLLPGWFFRRAQPRGIVFEALSQHPVAYASLEIIQHLEHTSRSAATLLTDAQGRYLNRPLAAGRYSFSVSHPAFTFPTLIPKATEVPLDDCYTGETIHVQGDLPSLLIPVDQAARVHHPHWRDWLLKLTALTGPLQLIFWLLSVCLTLLFPSAWNGLMLACYTLVLLAGFGQRLLAKATGIVVSQEGQPLPWSLLRFGDRLAHANSDGLFSMAGLPNGEHAPRVVKHGYRLAEQPETTHTPLTYQPSQLMIVVMAPSQGAV